MRVSRVLQPVSHLHDALQLVLGHLLDGPRGACHERGGSSGATPDLREGARGRRDGDSAPGGERGRRLVGRDRGGSRDGRCACVHSLRRGVYVHAYPRMWNRSRWPPERLGSDESNRPSRRKISPLRSAFSDPVHWRVFGASSGNASAARNHPFPPMTSPHSHH